MNTQCKTQIGQALYTEYCKATGGKNYAGEPLPSATDFWADSAKNTQILAWESVAEKTPQILANHVIDTHVSKGNAQGWLKFGLSVAAGIAAALGYLSATSCTSVDLSPGNAVIEGESGKLEVTQDRLSWSQKAPQVLVVENVKPVK